MSDDVSKYWQEIGEGLFVIKADGLEDFRAVVGSKTSRATDLSIRADISNEGIEKFLTANLAGYGHASIGEMSFPTVHHRGIGWMGAWMMEDDPLFVGQEVSTRAVDVRKLPNGHLPAYDAPDFLQGHNDLFWNIFKELDEKNPETRGYKFDRIRWAMPGSARVGVTYMMNARAAMRHLERLEAVPFMGKCVNNFLKGVETCSPYVYNALRKGPRAPQNRWTTVNTIVKRAKDLDLESSVELAGPYSVEETHYFKNMKEIAPRPDKDYLDPALRSLGVFKLRIFTSIAGARDWHRHRPVMPWQINLVTDEDGLPYVAPWYDTTGYEADVKNDIKENFTKAKPIFESANDKMQGFYAMPYGTMVAIDAYATLPDLLYMCELRCGSGGVNFEYAEQGISGLKQICKIMGKEFTEYHSLDRVLKKINRV